MVQGLHHSSETELFVSEGTGAKDRNPRSFTRSHTSGGGGEHVNEVAPDGYPMV